MEEDVLGGVVRKVKINLRWELRFTCGEIMASHQGSISWMIAVKRLGYFIEMHKRYCTLNFGLSI